MMIHVVDLWFCIILVLTSAAGPSEAREGIAAPANRSVTGPGKPCVYCYKVNHLMMNVTQLSFLFEWVVSMNITFIR
jgi:hypothetical protein